MIEMERMEVYENWLRQHDEFLQLMEASAVAGHASVASLQRILTNPSVTPTLDEFVASRRKDKEITVTINERLCREAMPGLDREDIETLAGSLYRIPKTVEKFAERYILTAPQLRTIDFSRADVLLYEAFQFILSILVVFVCTRLVNLMGQTFRTRATIREAFTAVAYGLSPMFLLRFGDAFPQISPWATWGAGIVLSVWILYQGLPRVMNPDPTHAFGLYLMTAMVLVLVTGLARLLTALYLMQHIRHIAADIKTFLPGVHF